MSGHPSGSPSELTMWDARMRQQAGWTRSIRQHLFGKIQINPGERLLEVGSGTRAILVELNDAFPSAIHYGLDYHFESLQFSIRTTRQRDTVCGNAFHLPFPEHTFQLTCCHFLLLWLEHPEDALAEMRRVTRPGGWVMALAEPDYGGRIYFPEHLEYLGSLQTAALQKQGASTTMGRQLNQLFNREHFQNVLTGVLGGEWQQIAEANQAEWEQEWQMMESDLSDQVPEAVLEQYRKTDYEAFQHGGRVMFVPTFYAAGQLHGN